MTSCPFAFRIKGDCSNPRRLVDAGAAFAAHAACDDRAELHRECFLSAFHFGEDFREHLAAHDSPKGFDGPCWSPWIWWDIDRADNLPAALADARRLVVAIEDGIGIDDDALLIFYSGSKGFHVGAPVCPAAAASATFNRVARRFAEIIASAAGVTIDPVIYTKVQPFRAPNSRHPRTGLHKRRLSAEELLHLRIEAIQDMARTPAPFDVPEAPVANDRVAALWRNAEEQVRRESEAHAQRKGQGNGAAKLNRLTLEFIRNGAADGDRHRLLFSAAANLAEFGCPEALAHALLSDAALDSGLSPSEVKRQIDCGLNHKGAAP